MLEGERVPRHTLPKGELPPDVAYQIIHDELMIDGNARLNLATFVTTWMEPQARSLMDECLDKNMIDKDEYPQTAEIETRCVNILSTLWHALEIPDGVRDAVGGLDGPVLVVDDRIETGWTMTVAARLLRQAGAPAALPFALAVTAG